MRGRRISAGVVAAALFAALLGPLWLAGCSPDAAEFRERAERYLAEGLAAMEVDDGNLMGAFFSIGKLGQVAR